MMGLFDKLGQKSEAPAQMTPETMRREIGNISSNPSAYLCQRGFRIPDGMTDAKEITQYLLRTGQIGGGKLRQIMGMLGVPGMK